MTPTTNHEVIQKYIDNECYDDMSKDEVIAMLVELQSRLIEPMEYEIGKEYAFSDEIG